MNTISFFMGGMVVCEIEYFKISLSFLRLTAGCNGRAQ
jgi:hypothetical protein